MSVSAIKFIKNLIFYPTEDEAAAISRSVFDLEIEDLINSDSFFQKKIGSKENCLTYENIVMLLSSNKIDDKTLRHFEECSECSRMYKDAKDRINKFSKKLGGNVTHVENIQH